MVWEWVPVVVEAHLSMPGICAKLSVTAGADAKDADDKSAP